MNVRTNLLLPKELVDEIDHFAGERGRSRYVTQALRAQVRRDRLREVVEQTAGAWADNPLWKDSEDVVNWVRTLRAEDRDPWAGHR
jgi:predicted transcriptional regulator